MGKRCAGHDAKASHPPGGAMVFIAGLGAWRSELKRAQAQSKFKDGGAARDYSLIKGWASSYPETSGYIVPALIKYARRINDA